MPDSVGLGNSCVGEDVSDSAAIRNDSDRAFGASWGSESERDHASGLCKQSVSDWQPWYLSLQASYAWTFRPHWITWSVSEWAM